MIQNDYRVEWTRLSGGESYAPRLIRLRLLVIHTILHLSLRAYNLARPIELADCPISPLLLFRRKLRLSPYFAFIIHA